MSEWKELDPLNMPSDILAGDYEFCWKCNLSTGHSWFTIEEVGITRLGECLAENFRAIDNTLVYRKRQPKAPSHEEIMKPRYWENDNHVWVMIVEYWSESKEGQYILTDGTGVSKEWFVDRQSADIPPEDMHNE